MTTPPHWDLSKVYPGLESREYEAAVDELKRQIEASSELISRRMAAADVQSPVADLAALAGEAVRGFNQAYELSSTLRSYIYSFVSTDSQNDLARRRLSQYEQVYIHLAQAWTRFQAWTGRLSPVLDQVIAADRFLEEHAFMLRETAEQARYLMSEVEESLAAEMYLSGAGAWGKLQGTITSQLSADFELDGEVHKLPLPAIINLHSHPDEEVRRRAYYQELEMLDSVREPLAACMNGVKGTVNTLDRRRGRQDALHSAIEDARIDRPTLEAMLAAMHDSFPTFGRYFQAKARRLGKEKLAWWDIFAPLGASQKTYTFDEARGFILENFAAFSAHLANFAGRAFDGLWIDAEQRQGKRGGAFCMGLPLVKESRVLCNFDGSLAQVFTIAHELGHAFHHDCAYAAGKTMLQQNTPMTLAETASILCETIAMQAVLKGVRQSGAVAMSRELAEEELGLLENMLNNDAQVIVDIYSRYLFEKEVFDRRRQAELSADELCQIMEQVQRDSYGEALDERYLNRYMWAWKPHYYSAGLSFYNFPYAFGLLFGIGLYAVYQQRGAAFLADYESLLASTGEGSAADLAARFGIDIRSRQFWDDSLAVIAGYVERYCEIAAA
jgi:oligoendopeptidase F